MDLDRTQGLAFLLSLAALPMAGCPAATEDTTTSGTGDTTGDSQSSDPTTDPSGVSLTSDPTDASNSMSTTVEPTTEPTTNPSTVTDPTDATTTDPTDATETTDPTAETTSAEESTTDPSAEGTTGGDPLCTGFAAHVVECDPAYAMYEQILVGYCTEAIEYYAAYGPECGTAGEEFFACLAIADCDELVNGDPCQEEVAALNAACGGVGTSSGSDGGAGGE